MTTITIQLPDTLRQRAEQAATQRGGTIDDLLQELLEGYLEETKDGQGATEIKPHSIFGDERTYFHDIRHYRKVIGLNGS